MNNSTKKAQMQRFFECLKTRPMTTRMAEATTGIRQSNLTRYVADFEDKGIITTVEKKKCEESGYPAKYYSTDPKYFPIETEPELFPNFTNKPGVLE